MKAPLEGVRVVDLGAFVAGPYASVPLADLGADVIKIEPLRGEANRALWRAFAFCDRGKRVISIDLKNPKGLEIARKICVSADVVHHNFRPGVADRLGLGYASLSEENPQITYLETSAYGESGPMAALPGFDMMIQALTGHEHYGAEPGGEPHWYRWATVDCAGAMLGTIAMLGGLYKRKREETGSNLQVNLLDSGLYTMSELYRDADGKFHGLKPLNASKTGRHPAESIYATADGWIAIAAIGDAMRDALIDVLGLPELRKTDAADWGTAEQDLIAGKIKFATTNEWLGRLRGSGVWADACREHFGDDFLNDPWFVEQGLVSVCDQPEYGELRQIGRSAIYSGFEKPAADCGRVASLGEHTREILAEFGYTTEEIDDFYEQGIVA